MAYNARDQTRLDESMKSPEREYFVTDDAQYIKIVDSNFGSYNNGQIIFDGTTLANARGFVNVADSFFMVPVSATVKFTPAATATNTKILNSHKSWKAKQLLTIKGQSVNILNGIQIELNNQQIVSQTNWSHVPMHFIDVASTSPTDQELSSIANFGVNSAKSSSVALRTYNAVKSSNVQPDLCANRGSSSVFLPKTRIVNGANDEIVQVSTFTTNSSFYDKVSRLCTNAANDEITAIYDSNNYVFTEDAVSTVTPSTLDNSRISYVDVTNGGLADASATTVRFKYYLIIPLRKCHDLFAQMPLVKSLQFRITLFTHLPLTYTFTGESSTSSDGCNKYVNETLVNTSNYNPLLLAYPGSTDSPSFVTAAAASANYSYVVTAGITNDAESTSILTGAKSCELWIKSVILSPEAENTYLQQPKRRIVFQDFQRIEQTGMKAIEPGMMFSGNIHTGIQRPRSLLITTQMYQKNQKTIPQSISGIVETGGVTSAPFVTFSNFMVRIGGKNIWNWPMEYNYDYYYREIVGLNSMTGNLVPGITTGDKLSYDNWFRSNEYLPVDLARHLKCDDDSFFSIDLDFKNTSKQYLGLICYILYEKEFQIDVMAGQIFV